MKVHFAVTDHEIACLLAEIAENEGMTANEWFEQALDDARFRLRQAVSDMRDTGASVRLTPRLEFD